MRKLFQYRRPIILGLIPLLSILFIIIPGYCQSTSSEEAVGTNLRWTTKGDIIVINYDLIGPLDAKYDVRFAMKKENDPTFKALPQTVEGDFGEGFFAGTNREVRWYYRRDYPQGLQGEGYFFEIYVKLIKPKTDWVYYAIGGAAVTAGLIAILLTKSQDTQPPQSELPLPPGRPIR